MSPGVLPTELSVTRSAAGAAGRGIEQSTPCRRSRRPGQPRLCRVVAASRNPASARAFRRPIVALLTFVAALLCAVPATARNDRLVPQPVLTSVNPRLVLFHPNEQDTLMVLNWDGRIDILNIRDWESPVKTAEILAAATTAAFSPDGTQLVSGGRHSEVTLWDVASGLRAGPPLEHPGGIGAVAFSPDGKSVASGGVDGTVRLWDVASRRSRWTTRTQSCGVSTLAFSPDGGALASGDGCGMLQFWDAHDGTLTSSPVPAHVGHLGTVSTVTFTHDGTQVASLGLGGLRFWDAGSGARVGPLGERVDWISAVAFSPDRTRLVAVTASSTLRMWDVRTADSMGPPFRARVERMSTLAFSADGTRLVTDSDDGTLHLWDVASGTATGPPLQHSARLRTVLFAPDGTGLLSGDVDGRVRHWQLHRGNASPLSEYHVASIAATVAFSPDGVQLVVGGRDGALRFRNVATGAAIGSPLEGHVGSVRAVAFSPDGDRLASAGADGALRFWDVTSKTSPGSHVVGGAPPLRGVSTLAFSPDGVRLVLLDDEGALQFWDVNSRTPTQVFEHPERVKGFAFSPNGTSLASVGTDGTLRFWNSDTGTSISYSLDYLPSSERVEAVAFNRETARFASLSEDATLRFWDPKTGAPTGPPLRQLSEFIFAAFSPDGDVVGTVASDGSLRFWDVASGTAKDSQPDGRAGWWSYPGGYRLPAGAFSPDGTVFTSVGEGGSRWFWDVNSGAATKSTPELSLGASFVFGPDGTRAASVDGGVLHIWDVTAGTAVSFPLARHRGPIRRFAATREGALLASAGDDGTVRLWDIDTGTSRGEPLEDSAAAGPVAFGGRHGTLLANAAGLDGQVRVWDVANWTERGTPLQHGDPVQALAFNPDGTLLASGGFGDTVRVWDVANPTATANDREEPAASAGTLPHPDTVNVLAFSPDGQLLASGDGDGVVRLWRVTTDGGLHAAMEGHTGAVYALSFSSDGRFLASGDGDGTIRLWDVRRGRAFGTAMVGHTEAVFALAFSSSDEVQLQLASGSNDRTVRLWHIPGGRLLGPLPIAGSSGTVTATAFSGDGTRLVSGDREGTLRLWDLPSARALASISDAEIRWPSEVALNRDGTRLMARSRNATLVWQLDDAGTPVTNATTKLPLEYPARVRTAILSRDGTHIASVSPEETILWDIAHGILDRFPTNDQDHGGVLSVAFNPLGTLLATGNADGVVRIRSVENGTSIGTLDGGSGASAVAFSPDGAYLASTHGSDMNLWDVRPPWPATLASTWREWPPVESASDLHFSSDGARFGRGVFNPDGSRLLSHNDGTVTLWNADTGERLSSIVTCPGAPHWLASHAVAISCSDRILLLDDNLNSRGQLFLQADGFIATWGSEGVYASPQSLARGVCAFGQSGECGIPDLLAFDAMRRALFDDRSRLLSMWLSMQPYVAPIVYGIGRVDGWFGRFGPLGRAVGWFFAMLLFLVGGMYYCVPRKLATMAMWASDDPSGKLFSKLFLRRASLVILWAGTLERPLKKWFEGNRQKFEDKCFTERPQTRDRLKYLPLESEVGSSFKKNVDSGERGLLWIHGVGGTGKTALAMYILREMISNDRTPGTPVPVLVDVGWEGSLVEQIARQLRDAVGCTGLKAAMVERLGGCGLICPLVDSLSERGSRGKTKEVNRCIADRAFRHLIVTSREKPEPAQAIEQMKTKEAPELKKENVEAFIKTYVGNGDDGKVRRVNDAIRPFIETPETLSPLFLRFAVEQAEKATCAGGTLAGRIDSHWLLIERYLDGLRIGQADNIRINAIDMRRGAGSAAIVAVRSGLCAAEFSEVSLLEALRAEEDRGSFRYETHERADEKMAPQVLIGLLESSGLLVKGGSGGGTRYRFAYDPIAEYLAAERILAEDMKGLRGRVVKEEGVETAVGRAYAKLSKEPSVSM